MYITLQTLYFLCHWKTTGTGRLPASSSSCHFYSFLPKREKQENSCVVSSKIQNYVTWYNGSTRTLSADYIPLKYEAIRLHTFAISQKKRFPQHVYRPAEPKTGVAKTKVPVSLYQQSFEDRQSNRKTQFQFSSTFHIFFLFHSSSCLLRWQVQELLNMAAQDSLA